MRAAVPVAAALLLLLAVLWVRGGTGWSEVPGDDAAAPTDTAGADATAGAAPVADLGRAALWPVRLGTPVASLPEGLAVGAAGTSGCRPLLRDPGGSGGPVGWVVDGRVVSVAAHRRGDTGEAVPLAAWVAPEELADVDALLAAPAARHRPEVVDRPDLRLLVDVTTVAGDPDTGLTLVGSDLGGGGGTAWLELREDAAAGCAPDGDVARVLPDASGVPPADDGGWQDVRIGDPLPAPVAGTRAEREERGACTVLPAADPDDPLSVVLLAEGVVRGVGLRAGGLDGVVAVGDPPERLRSALPDRVGAAELRAMRDNGGVAVGLGGGVRLVVGVARPTAVVPGVDVPVPGPDLLVASVLVAQPCT